MCSFYFSCNLSVEATDVCLIEFPVCRLLLIIPCALDLLALMAGFEEVFSLVW